MALQSKFKIKDRVVRKSFNSASYPNGVNPFQNVKVISGTVVIIYDYDGLLVEWDDGITTYAKDSDLELEVVMKFTNEMVSLKEIPSVVGQAKPTKSQVEATKISDLILANPQILVGQNIVLNHDTGCLSIKPHQNILSESFYCKNKTYEIFHAYVGPTMYGEPTIYISKRCLKCGETSEGGFPLSSYGLSETGKRIEFFADAVFNWPKKQANFQPTKIEDLEPVLPRMDSFDPDDLTPKTSEWRQTATVEKEGFSRWEKGSHTPSPEQTLVDAFDVLANYPDSPQHLLPRTITVPDNSKDTPEVSGPQTSRIENEFPSSYQIEESPDCLVGRCISWHNGGFGGNKCLDHSINFLCECKVFKVRGTAPLKKNSLMPRLELECAKCGAIFAHQMLTKDIVPPAQSQDEIDEESIIENGCIFEVGDRVKYKYVWMNSSAPIFGVVERLQKNSSQPNNPTVHVIIDTGVPMMRPASDWELVGDDKDEEEQILPASDVMSKEEEEQTRLANDGFDVGDLVKKKSGKYKPDQLDGMTGEVKSITKLGSFIHLNVLLDNKNYAGVRSEWSSLSTDWERIEKKKIPFTVEPQLPAPHQAVLDEHTKNMNAALTKVPMFASFDPDKDRITLEQVQLNPTTHLMTKSTIRLMEGCSRSGCGCKTYKVRQFPEMAQSPIWFNLYCVSCDELKETVPCWLDIETVFKVAHYLVGRKFDGKEIKTVSPWVYTEPKSIKMNLENGSTIHINQADIITIKNDMVEIFKE